MQQSHSLLQDLLQELPQLRSQVYFKASLIALSHAIEDLVLAQNDAPLVIVSWQKARSYWQAAQRYQRIVQRTDQVYVLATPDIPLNATLPNVEVIPLDVNNELAQEWHWVVIGQSYAACLVCREYAAPVDAEAMDQYRQFQGLWTFDRQVSLKAAQLLLGYISDYRPDLATKTQQAQQVLSLTALGVSLDTTESTMTHNVKLFSERLMTYLQASQYKLLKAYRTIATQAQKQALINQVCEQMRQSLDAEQILEIMVRELSHVFLDCRCLLYRCDADGSTLPVEYEFCPPHLKSIKGQVELLSSYPLFRFSLSQSQSVVIADVQQDLSLNAHPDLRTQLENWQIGSCLLVPMCYQKNWLGVLELHYPHPHLWPLEDVGLVEAIATQAGVALIQAQAYANLEKLNHQLLDLERNQRNLIAIVGHELRTPLSTIRVCLESLITMPDMPLEVYSNMLDVALSDTERLRKLIQDFLTLSQLESGLIRWQVETVVLEECLGLVLNSIKGTRSAETLPQINIEIPRDLPPIQSDGDGIIEVLTKLLDNACKFTSPEGKVSIRAKVLEPTQTLPPSAPILQTTEQVEVVISDTGRGIDSTQLEQIFDRFYQEEGFLQRTIGGTGLGLAICRRIIQGLGGHIWAFSPGKNQGSELHFTLPVAV